MKLLDRIARYFGYVDIGSTPTVLVNQTAGQRTWVSVTLPGSNGQRFSGWLDPWQAADGDPFQPPDEWRDFGPTWRQLMEAHRPWIKPTDDVETAPADDIPLDEHIRDGYA